MKLTKSQIENYKKAGNIAKQIKGYSRQIVKKDVLLSEIAEKIESKITELGGKVAFPVNLSINEIAAHNTPSLNEDSKANGLLKIDLGVHVNGCVVDTAITIDLTSEKKHKKMIESNERALEKAINLIKKNKKDTFLNEIGKIIHDEIISAGFSPIRNLSGHSIEEYNVHAGLTIPNYDNGNKKEIGEGIFAVEPFATTGSGIVYSGENSNIYHLSKDGQVRDSSAREILLWIHENKKTLPFSEREIERKFGTRTKLALKRLETASIISSFEKLIEKSHQPVSQAENTLLIYNGKVEVLT